MISTKSRKFKTYWSQLAETDAGKTTELVPSMGSLRKLGWLLRPRVYQFNELIFDRIFSYIITEKKISIKGTLRREYDRNEAFLIFGVPLSKSCWFLTSISTSSDNISLLEFE